MNVVRPNGISQPVLSAMMRQNNITSASILKHIASKRKFYGLSYSGHSCTAHGLPFPTRDRDVVVAGAAVLQCRLADGGVGDFGVCPLQYSPDFFEVEAGHAGVLGDSRRADFEDARLSLFSH